METGNTVEISIERFQQLIRAEQDANQLKTLIADAYNSYATLDRVSLALLNKLYFGNKEDSEV